MSSQPDVIAAILIECQSLARISNESACEIEMRARRQYGGRKNYIPRIAPRADADVVRAVVLECKLSTKMDESTLADVETETRKKYGGRHQYVNSAKQLEFLTPALIDSRKQQGEKMNEIANHYGITRMTIYNILRRGRKQELANRSQDQ